MFRTPRNGPTPLQRAAAAQQLSFNVRRLPVELQERVLGHYIRSRVGRMRTGLRARTQITLRRNATHNQPSMRYALRRARTWLRR